MKYGKKLLRLLWLFLFAFMLAICLVLGVAPIIPKRKEEAAIEIKMEQKESEDERAVLWESKEEKL